MYVKMLASVVLMWSATTFTGDDVVMSQEKFEDFYKSSFYCGAFTTINILKSDKVRSCRSETDVVNLAWYTHSQIMDSLLLDMKKDPGK